PLLHRAKDLSCLRSAPYPARRKFHFQGHFPASHPLSDQKTNTNQAPARPSHHHAQRDQPSPHQGSHSSPRSNKHSATGGLGRLFRKSPTWLVGLRWRFLEFAQTTPSLLVVLAAKSSRHFLSPLPSHLPSGHVASPCWSRSWLKRRKSAWCCRPKSARRDE